MLWQGFCPITGIKGKSMLRLVSVVSVVGLVLLNYSANASEQNGLDFGRVRMSTSQVDSAVFHNHSGIDLMVTSISVDQQDFSLPSLPFTGDLAYVAHDEARSIPIKFSAQDSGIVTGNVLIETSIGEYRLGIRGESVAEVVVINEVLADPPPGSAGDANGDGVRNSNEDEFVELLNTGKYAVNVGGWQLFDAGASNNNRLTFPSPTWVNPSERITVFGGSADGFDGQVYSDDGRIGGGLRNSGDQIFLYNPELQDTMASMSYGQDGGKNESMVRWPEGIGEWVLHSQIPGVTDLFSPNQPYRAIEKLKIIPRDTTIALGDSLSLNAIGIYDDGDIVPFSDNQISLSIQREGILEKISGSGVLGVGEGVTQIAVQVYEVLRDTVTVKVKPPRIARIRIQIPDTIMFVGESQSLMVIAHSSSGMEFELREEFEVVLSDSSILEIVGTKVYSNLPGTTTLTVRNEDLADSTRIQVLNLGDLNRDGLHTIWDAVRTVHLILEIEPAATNIEVRAADMNQDGELDITDLILIIREILGVQEVSPKYVFKSMLPSWAKTEDGFKLTLPNRVVAVSFQFEESDGLEQITSSKGVLFRTHQGDETRVIVLFPEGKISNAVEQIVHIGGVGRILPLVLKVFTLDGEVLLLTDSSMPDKLLSLTGIYPNPLNPATTIHFNLLEPAEISLKIFSITGQLIREIISEEYKARGTHVVVWDAKDESKNDVAAGVYIVRLESVLHNVSRKILVLR